MSTADAFEQLVKAAAQARREGHPEDAQRDLLTAVEQLRKAKDPIRLAGALSALGQIERDLHHREAALKHYAEALALYRDHGDVLAVAHAVRHVGDIYLEMGRSQAAEPCFEEALEIYRMEKSARPLDLANAIRGMAMLKSDAGEVDEAMMLWTEARDLYASLEVQAGVAESSRRLALLARAGGKN